MYGRKHCYRLYTKHFNEAVHWACAIQKIIDTKAPVETPTQLLIRDIEVGHRSDTTVWSHHATPKKKIPVIFFLTPPIYICDRFHLKGEHFKCL